MNNKRRGLLATTGYGLIIILIHFLLEINDVFFVFAYIPYVLGGCAVLAFFSGRLVQKIGITKSFYRRIFYTTIVGVALFIGCCILYRNPYHFEGEYFLANVLGIDARILFMLTLPGFLIGQFYQYKKSK